MVEFYSFKRNIGDNIDILSIDGVKSIKIGACAQIWAYGFWLIIGQFLYDLDTCSGD